MTEPYRDSLPLRGMSCLVTGGAKRVGRAIIRELAAAGCDIVIHYRHSRDEAMELKSEILGSDRRCVVIDGDLSDPTTWPRLIDESVSAMGRLDILVNNASAFQTYHPDTIESFDVEAWEKTLRINLLAPVSLCYHASAHLKANGCGRIVNLGDTAVERPGSAALAYYASKAALAAMTKSLARAFAPDICVNAVAPGIAVFPEDYSERKRRDLVTRVPLKREGTPEEVARVVRFLVESGDYITGQTIAIDGGRNLV